MILFEGSLTCLKDTLDLSDLQERMRESVKGKAACNIYLAGKHRVGLGASPPSGNSILPPTENISGGGGLSLSSRMKKPIFLFREWYIVQFLPIVLQVILRYPKSGSLL